MENNKGKNIIGFPALVAYCVVTILLILVATHKPVINLNKYISVEFSGYDTIGKANVVVDEEKLEKDIKRYEKGSIRFRITSFEAYSAVNRAVSSCTLDKANKISNGDTVTLSWEDFDKEAFKNINVTYKSKSYKAKNLEAVELFDPFEHLSVVASGISPNGELALNVDTEDGLFETLSFVCDKTYGISKGESVTVYLYDSYIYSTNEDDIMNSFAERYGKVPSRCSETYVISELNELVTSSSQLTDEVITAMSNQAISYFENNEKTNWDSEVSLNEIKYCGNYFVTSAGENSFNEVIILLKVNCQINRRGKNTIYVGYYYPVRFYNASVDKNGKCSVNLENFDSPYSTYYVEAPDNWDYWYFNGYDEISDVKDEYISYRTGSIDYEESIID